MKKFLLSLCVGFLGIISFCSAGVINYFGHYSGTPANSKVVFAVPYPVISIPNNGDIFVSCSFSNINTLISSQSISFSSDRINFNTKSHTSKIITSYDIIANNSVSFQLGGDYISLYTTWQGGNTENISFDWLCTFSGNDVLSAGGSCPEVNTGEILSGYILESEIDTNYCVGNGLCPNECGSGTDMSGDLQYSNLFINNILHPGTENIFLNIQDNIFWDYSQSESGLIVDVGSGYDQDYIDGVINVQSYRPTSEDFTQTFVGGLILFTPYVVILLFVILVRNLIKKIFKTK